MNLVNHTPFPALAFEGVDQHNQSFQVVVLRQTLSFRTGKLVYADVQAPLCDADETFGTVGASSIRQESDLFLYKPKCDVIVNATAYSPNGKPASNVDVRLTVRKQIANASEKLIDKTLRVTGESFYRRNAWIVRAMQWCIKWGTLTFIQPSPWTRSQPDAFTALPLRFEYAFGGQCRINRSDNAAKRVPPTYLLTPEQLADHPDRDAASEHRPVAHAIFEPNPIGRGFALEWALNAIGSQEVAAPRIEICGESVTGSQFWRWSRSSKSTTEKAMQQTRVHMPAGMGVRSKGDPERRALMGTVDDAFVHGEAPLPNNFDFAYFNAAPPDQQIPYLLGDEVLELTNLCPPETPTLATDAFGNSILHLQLPKHECFGLIRLRNGEMRSEPLVIDTALIEPNEHTLTLVWRLFLLKDQQAPIRAFEVRMRTHEERDRCNAASHELNQLNGKDVTRSELGALEAAK